jgi:hypothetical protein
MSCLDWRRAHPTKPIDTGDAFDSLSRRAAVAERKWAGAGRVFTVLSGYRSPVPMD